MLTSIQFKLWLTIATILCLSLVATFTATHWRFKANFLNYVNQKSDMDARFVADSLVANYRLTDKWRDYKKTSQWRSHCLKSLAPYRSAERPKDGETFRSNRPLPDQLAIREFCRTAYVTDEHNKEVLGKKLKAPKYSHLDIYDEHETLIGTLHYARLSHIANVVDQVFVKQHRVAFIMIGSAVFIVASLLTLWLSRRLTKPIRRLSSNAQELRRGNFSVKTEVTSEDELGLLCENFNELAQTLDANLKSRQEWIANISHEMRTPISVIQGQIEAMIDGVRPADESNLDLINQKIAGLKRLIEDLHDLSMSELGALSYRKEPMPLSNTLNSSVASFEPRLEEKGISLSVDMRLKPNDLVLGDSTRLQQLFMNLFENSLRYTHAPGKIAFSAYRDGKQLIIKIKDSPPAVPEPALAKLFDKLFRMESSRSRNTGGSGLGLSICKNIVEAHFGRISAGHSDLGGLEMTVTLPAHDL